MKKPTRFFALLWIAFFCLPGFPVGAQGTDVQCGSIVQGEFTQFEEVHEYYIDLAPGDVLRVSAEVVGDYLSLKTDILSPQNVEIYGTYWQDVTASPSVETGILSARGTYTIQFENGHNGTGVYTVYIGCTLANGTVIDPGSPLAELPPGEAGGDTLLEEIPPPHGLMVFSSRVEDVNTVCVIDVSSGEVDEVGQGYLPIWSPNGKKIAFYSSGQIHIMETDGTNVMLLDTGLTGDNFVTDWSPDGRILFTNSAQSEIFVIDYEGANLMQLTDNDINEATPVWSLNVARIAFGGGDQNNHYEIYAMDADGSNMVQLTDTGGNSARPDWSPDGCRIVFHSSRDGNNEIYVMNADGGNPVRLTDNPGSDFAPVWSPDGNWIGFLRTGGGGNSAIYIISADGQVMHQLTDFVYQRLYRVDWFQTDVVAGEESGARGDSDGDCVVDIEDACPGEAGLIQADGCLVTGTATNAANLRSGPGVTYAVVGGLNSGQEFHIMGRNVGGDWLRIRTIPADDSESVEAWLAASLVTSDTPLEVLPIINE